MLIETLGALALTLALIVTVLLSEQQLLRMEEIFAEREKTSSEVSNLTSSLDILSFALCAEKMSDSIATLAVDKHGALHNCTQSSLGSTRYRKCELALTRDTKSVPIIFWSNC